MIRRVILAAILLAAATAAAVRGAGAQVAVPPSRQATSVAIVTVKGEIDAVTRTSVERRVAG